MKRFLICAALLVAFTASTYAIGPSVGFGAHLNAANISVNGTMKDVYGLGIGGGAHLDVNLAMLAFRLSADYINFSPDIDKYRTVLQPYVGSSASQYSISGGKISIISANANLKVNILPLPLLTPYATGGLGVVRMSADSYTVTQNGTPVLNAPGFEPTTNSSANLGVGADLSVGITLFIEAKYTWIFASGGTSTYIPVSIGVTF